MKLNYQYNINTNKHELILTHNYSNKNCKYTATYLEPDFNKIEDMVKWLNLGFERIAEEGNETKAD